MNELNNVTVNDIAGMTIPQLKCVAAANKIELGKLKKKQDILDKISEALFEEGTAPAVQQTEEESHTPDQTDTTAEERADAPAADQADTAPEESAAARAPEQTDTAPENSTAAPDPEPDADEVNAADNAAGDGDNENAGADHGNGDPDNADTATPEQAAHGWEVARVLKVTKPLIQGDDVKALQEALIAHNYHCGVTGADGIYAKNTAYAVRCFQSAHGLIVDGKAGRYTVAALGGVWKG